MINAVELTAYLKKQNLLLVDKSAFSDFMVSVHQKIKVDKRVLYISRNDALLKYNLNKYWFQKYENNVNSLLVFRQGKKDNAKKLYKEQSILDELERQELCG